jgi:Ca2+-binding EF-hand superfamily protein
MSMTRKLVALLVGMLLVVGSVSTAAFAASNRTAGAARSDVQQLLRLMDMDKNGTVSKDEFLQFMSETYDSLDVDRSRQLEPKELRRMTIPNWLLKSVCTRKQKREVLSENRMREICTSGR